MVSPHPQDVASPAVPRRRLGSSDLCVSTLAFGSMRLLASGLTRRQAIDLLLQLVDSGVDCFHSSFEYESFPLFADVMSRVRALRPGATLAHIGKIGVPDFGEDRFDPRKFEAAVERYLAAFGIECLDVVEWLLRFDLEREDRRLAIFDADAEMVSAAFERLQRAGKLGAVVSFPYTRAMAQRHLAVEWCDGLALYINPLERDLADLLDAATSAAKGVIGIRPFAAKRAVAPGDGLQSDDRAALTRMGDAWPKARPGEGPLRYALAHPAVTTTVASINSPMQATAALAAVREGVHDIDRFRFVASG